VEEEETEGAEAGEGGEKAVDEKGGERTREKG
jgi:hypothetical protein